MQKLQVAWRHTLVHYTHHFVWGFVHADSISEICAEAAGDGADTTFSGSLKICRTAQIVPWLWESWSLMMSHWFTGTAIASLVQPLLHLYSHWFTGTAIASLVQPLVHFYRQKPACHCHSEDVHHPRGLKEGNHGRSAATSKSCWSFCTDLSQCDSFQRSKYYQKFRLSVIFMCRKWPDLWAVDTWEMTGFVASGYLATGLWQLFCSSHLNLTFLAKHNITLVHRLDTLTTWLLVTFGYSLKCCWKWPDLSHKKTLCGAW